MIFFTKTLLIRPSQWLNQKIIYLKFSEIHKKTLKRSSARILLTKTFSSLKNY